MKIVKKLSTMLIACSLVLSTAAFADDNTDQTKDVSGVVFIDQNEDGTVIYDDGTNSDGEKDDGTSTDGDEDDGTLTDDEGDGEGTVDDKPRETPPPGSNPGGDPGETPPGTPPPTIDEGREIKPEEIALFEYIMNEYKKFPEKIDIPAEYDITEARFKELYSVYYGPLLQNDHGEMWYAFVTGEGEDSQMGIDSVDGKLTAVKPVYTTTNPSERSIIQNAIDNAVDEITAGIKESMTDFEKILHVHDYIVANYEYDQRVYSDDETVREQANRTLDKMVMQKTGVCQGYSYLFKYVMDTLGFECVTVPASECGHMWNKIKLDGKWYNIDLTYDDPSPDLANNIQHYYFLLNDEEIKEADSFITIDDDGNEVVTYGLHRVWDETKWDGSPVETSDNTEFSENNIHYIIGQIVNTGDKWYAFDHHIDDENEEYEYNLLCEVDLDTGNTTPVFNSTSNFLWKNRYTLTPYAFVSSLTYFNGNMYFNSPSKVYRYDISSNSAKEVFDYETAYPDAADESQTYIFGLRVIDNELYIEHGAYLTSLIPIAEDDTDTEADIEFEDGKYLIGDDEYYEGFDDVKIISKISASASKNSDGDAVITLDIPEAIEDVTRVFIAEYDANNALIGIRNRDKGESEVTFTPGDSTAQVKTFIWTDNNMYPLTSLSPLNFTPKNPLPSPESSDDPISNVDEPETPVPDAPAE